MKSITIINGRVITPKKVIVDGVIVIENGRIVAVDEAKVLNIPTNSEVLDAHGMFISPGFIDAHTHGAIGYDFMESNQDEIAEILRWLPSTGTTGVLPTIATTNFYSQIRMLEQFHIVLENNPAGAAILGVHLEGPYISPDKRGAQPEQDIRLPSVDEMAQLIEHGKGMIKLVTLAPELPGAIELIKFLTHHGILTSIGHSNASYDQVMIAASAGLTRASHFYNAMTGFHHREPGVVGAVLTCEDIYAEIILDGVHVHPAAVKVAIRAKGINRLVLVTDATQATGLGNGTYLRPGNRQITVKNGVARLDSGTLAGSVLTMNQAVFNAMDLLGLDIVDAVKMASWIAAKSLGLGMKKGSITPGKDADLLIMDKNAQIRLTMVEGEIVYQAPEEEIYKTS